MPEWLCLGIKLWCNQVKKSKGNLSFWKIYLPLRRKLTWKY